MVANESEALRWVTRQWERRIETARCDFKCLRNVMRVVQ